MLTDFKINWKFLLSRNLKQRLRLVQSEAADGTILMSRTAMAAREEEKEDGGGGGGGSTTGAQDSVRGDNARNHV